MPSSRQAVLHDFHRYQIKDRVYPAIRYLFFISYHASVCYLFARTALRRAQRV
jgi:hypothetical protein